MREPVPTGTPISVSGKFPGGFLGGTTPKSYFYWVVEPWTANETPFLTIESQVKQQLRTNTPQKLWESYRKKALANPLDAKAQYRWAYTGFEIFSRRWKSGRDESWSLKGILEAMEKPKSPRSYRYTRIRMFMHEWDQNWYIRGKAQIRECAFRLLKRNPNDEDIKYAFAFDLSLTSNPVREQDLAYTWARDYSKKYPNEPKTWYLMGYVLNSRFDRTQSRRMADEALAYLKKCQAGLPENHFYQGRLKTQVARNSRNRQIFERAKKLKA